ncbi:MAG: hypothetical protein EOO56_00380 [Hymenobacter sp.]|nr:MAG: hypothetical protein EOO56_00380 [Hymenobacter sp.]
MQLSEEAKHTLLVAVHQLIEEQAGACANDVFRGETVGLDYPPNGGLSTKEVVALQTIQGNALVQAALRKVLASCAAGVVFDLLGIIDGTIDPEHGDWSGVMLIDRPEEVEEHRQFLHDAFFETYWDWRTKRRNKNWRLDNLPD